MIYNPYEILGVDKTVTKQELEQTYHRLRRQYLDARFAEGEEGEIAAEKLQQIETAYKDILTEMDEAEHQAHAGDSSAECGDFAEIQSLLKENKLDEAQQKLDERTVHNGEWHYMQSILFYKRNWFLESKKQLEMACQLEPDNKRYAESLKKLTKILASNTINPDQMRTTERPTEEQSQFAQGADPCSSACVNCCMCTACYDCMRCMICR